jgi:tetratricopeptide (TPR) repeat protein
VLALLEQVAEKQPAALARAAPRLVKLLGHRDSAIQEQAGQILILVGAAGVAAVPRLLLRPLTARKTDPELKLHAILTAQPLAERDPKQFAPAVRHLAHDLGHQRWEIREQAALLLGIMGRKKMGLIKDAVPSLVHALNDGDELVRTAAAKAMEEIKVSSLDYDALQKASAALESARGVLHSAQNFGVVTGQADKLLADAEKAYARGDYPKCMDYSTRAEDIAARAEKDSDRAKAALTRAESTIQSVSHKGVSIAAAEALLAEAEKLLQKQRYKEAHEKAEQAVLLSQQQAVESRPDIVLRGRVESPLVPDGWSTLSLELENIGGAVARQITLDFGDSFATRGQTLLHGMEATEKRTLEIEIYPKGKGLVPLTVDVVYHSFEGANFHQQKQDIIEVGDATEFESRELFASAVGATVVPKTQTSIVTRRFHIDCSNCGARLPSDFRICGKCGVRLRKRVERSETGYHCLECNSPLSLNQKFCGGCGAAAPAKPGAPTICPQCDGALEAGQKFCGGCGAPIILA